MDKSGDFGVERRIGPNGRLTTLSENLQGRGAWEMIQMMVDRLYGLSPKVVREMGLPEYRKSPQITPGRPQINMFEDRKSLSKDHRTPQITV